MPNSGNAATSFRAQGPENPRGTVRAVPPGMRKYGIAVLLLLVGCDDVLGPKVINEKLVCSGNDFGMGSFKLVLTEGDAAQWGEAFAATGNCDATVEKSIFVSPGVALRASGNTRLVFEGGRIEGNPAMDLSGNATIEIRGTEVVGEIKTSGNAKVIGLEPSPS